MPSVSKQEVQEWRNHPVTLEVMAAVKQRVEDTKNELISSSDPDYDRFLKGMIWAYQELIAVKLEETPDLIDIEKAE